MTLIHAGYAQYIPSSITKQIEIVEETQAVKQPGVNRKGKKRGRLTEEIKERITEPAIKMVLDGKSHLAIYEYLLSSGLLYNENGKAIGYVTVSRYITDAKRKLCIDVRPLYLKVRDYLDKGMDNAQIAKAIGISIKMVRRARSKSKCVEKRERLTGEENE
jgi:DNA-binding NarL/FixJ family response regulator